LQILCKHDIIKNDERYKSKTSRSYIHEPVGGRMKMRAIVFIDGPDDGHKEAEERLKKVMYKLGVESYNYVIARGTIGIKKALSEDNVDFVFTYGVNPKAQEIATFAGKTVIEYTKDSENFTLVKTRKEGGYFTSWRIEEYALIRC